MIMICSVIVEDVLGEQMVSISYAWKTSSARRSTSAGWICSSKERYICHSVPWH